LPYVECDPRGFGAQPDRCQRVDVRGYPTWTFGAQRIEGVLSLDQLAQLSRFPPPEVK
jgi:hypothetical protein